MPLIVPTFTVFSTHCLLSMHIHHTPTKLHHIVSVLILDSSLLQTYAILTEASALPHQFTQSMASMQSSHQENPNLSCISQMCMRPKAMEHTSGDRDCRTYSPWVKAGEERPICLQQRNSNPRSTSFLPERGSTSHSVPDNTNLLEIWQPIHTPTRSTDYQTKEYSKSIQPMDRILTF